MHARVLEFSYIIYYNIYTRGVLCAFYKKGESVFMRGKHYDADKRRVISSSGYIGVIIAVVILAAILTLTLLVYIPSTEERKADKPSIVGISYSQSEIGMGSDLDSVYVTVKYSDDTEQQVAISDMEYAGIDVTVAGKQRVSLSYGGFQQTIEITVKDVNVTLKYVASQGGRIQGKQSQSVKSGQDAETVIAIPDIGYTFVQWEDGYPYAVRKDRRVNKDLTHQAIFRKTKFRVQFYFHDGTTSNEETVVYGEAATKVPNEETEPRMRVYGYKFIGWSVAESDYKNVVRDMNIYPQYVKAATDVDITATLDEDGSPMGLIEGRPEGYYAYGEAGIIARPNNSREFNCWYILNSDGVMEELGKLESKLIYIGDDRVPVQFTSEKESNSQSDYKITFNCSEKIAKITMQAGFVYSRSSITFINYENKNAGNREYLVDNLPFKEEIGTYLENADNVNLTPDGLVQPDDVIGMNFEGWYRKGDAEQKLITRYATFERPTTLIAKWSKKTYDVVFNYYDNDGLAIEYGRIKVEYQKTIGSGGGVPAGIPVRDKYLFTGWMIPSADASDGFGLIIDDATQIVYRPDLAGSDSFRNDNLINVVATWKAVEHSLTVSASGRSGTVFLRTFSQETGDVISETSVIGSCVIDETHDYEVFFLADSGNTVSKARHDYNGKTETFSAESGSDFTKFAMTLQNRYDNVIYVEFDTKTYKVNVRNGSEYFSGNVRNSDGAVYNQDEFDLVIDHGNAVELTVISPVEKYEIKYIYVSGTVNGVKYNDYLWADLDGQSKYEYTVTLENCTSDLSVRIIYSVRSYGMTFNIPARADGNAYSTIFNGSEATYESVKAGEVEYSGGEELFYVVRAREGKYISAVALNGFAYDLYAGANEEVFFYDWKVNGVSLGISLKRIDDEYFYSYGATTIGGVTYMYCETARNGEKTLFEVTDAENEVYEKVSILGANEEELLSNVYDTLDIKNRSVALASAMKDARITELKIAIKIKKSNTVRLSFEDITYKVVAETSDEGVASVSASSVKRNGSVTVKATPVTGYFVEGYYVNDGEFIAQTAAEQGGTMNATVTGITTDIKIRIKYSPVTYQAVFSNLSSLRAYVTNKNGDEKLGEKKEMRSAASFEYAYASADKFVISCEDGYYISSVKINGAAQAVAYGATSYRVVVDNFSSTVKVEVNLAKAVTNEPQTYVVAFKDESSPYVSAGINYDVTKTIIDVISDKCYDLSRIELRGKKNGYDRIITVNVNANGTVSVSDSEGVADETIVLAFAETSYAGALRIVLGNDAFDAGEEVSLVGVASAKRFALTVNKGENGSVTCANEVEYGAPSSVYVRADSHYYISSFKVNGNEISWRNKNWKNVSYDSTVGKYVSGEYVVGADDDVTIDVEFAVYSFSISVDASSINGETMLTVAGSTQTRDRINYGETLVIGMKSDEGYHIESVYINGMDAGYVPYSDNPNDNVSAQFEYANVMSDVTVKIVYAINRYSFKYELINDSANFEGSDGAGNLTTDLVSSGANGYTGISHGENFSMEIIPSLSAGYYVYSVAIRYKGYGSDKVTETLRYASDDAGIVHEKGGVIWFNKFIFGDNTDGATGVTADIELVRVTFKRYKYKITVNQNSDLISGKSSFAITNPVDSEKDVILFNGNEKYHYRNGIILASGENGVLTETDIKSTFRNGKWVFYSESSDKEYEFEYEYGLRYNVSLEPTEGYKCVEFFINGENRMNSLSNGRFNSNVYAEADVNYTFEILKFAVSVEAVVYNANYDLISSLRSSLFANVSVISGATDVTLDTTEGKETNIIELELSYGEYIKFAFTPNYDGEGIYLDSLIYNGAQRTFAGNPTRQVIYGGDGIFLNDDITIKCIFKVKNYTIGANVKYVEDIKNEQINTALSDDYGTSSWMVVWNGSTSVKLRAGSGYYIDYLKITLNDNGAITEETIKYSNIVDTYKQNNFIVDRNLEDVYDEALKDVLTIENVKGDYVVDVYFAREKFTAYYVINDPNMVETVLSEYNKYNSDYPGKTVDSKKSGNPWQLAVAAYDELSAVVTPKDGYEIVVSEVTVECGRYVDVVVDGKPDTVFEVFNDANGNPLVYYFALTKVGDNEARMFSFHDPVKSTTDFYITSDVRISFNLGVKRYYVGTEISRVNAVDDPTTTKSASDVKVSVVDRQGSKLLISGQIQDDRKFSNTGLNEILVAEHHGTISYSFDLPEGYVLDEFSVNGFGAEEMVNSGMAVYVPKRNEDPQKGTYYSYRMEINVSTALVNGSTSSAWSGSSDINVKISVSPITYGVKIVVNGSVLDYGTVDSRSAVTDDKTITVYSPSSVTHYSRLNMEAALNEGYQFVSVSSYLGYDNDYDESSPSAFVWQIGNYAVYNSLKRYDFNGENTKNTNMLTGYNVIYFVFNTSIRESEQYVYTEVYYNDNGNLTTKAFKDATDVNVGEIKITVVTDGTMVEETTDGVLGENGQGRKTEYFSTITILALAYDGFEVDVIKEKTSGNYIDAVNGVRGVEYLPVKEGNREGYRLIYRVDALSDERDEVTNEPLGRTFRVQFKQRTEVKVHVPAPYKYVSENNYFAYTSVTAYENGKAVSNSAYESGVKTVSEYLFDVSVGNMLTFIYKDIYPIKKVSTVPEYYTRDLKEVVEEILASGYDETTFEERFAKECEKYRVTSVKGENSGYQIKGYEEFWLYTDAVSRVVSTKVTYGAASGGVGGDVLYNNSIIETKDITVYESKISGFGKVLKLRAKAGKNYEFYRLKAMQIDKAKSASLGKMVYNESAVSMWQILDRNSVGNVESFNNLNNAYYKMLDYTFDAAKNEYVFSVWVCGDMNFEFEFYHTYNVSYGIYKTDYVTKYGQSGIISEGLTVENVRDTVYGSNAVTSAATSAKLSYGASFTVKADSQGDNYQFVGWYVNNKNTYRSLSKILPDYRYLEQNIVFNVKEMSSLIDKSGNEVDDVTVYAVFQPIINVTVLNEKYYVTGSEFNSWNMGSLVAKYYPFNLEEAIKSSAASVIIADEYGKKLGDLFTDEYVNKMLEYQDTGATGIRGVWNEILYDSRINQDMKDNATVYSAYANFSVLTQNVTDNDFINFSWKNSVLQLTMSAMKSDVKFYRWEYFNWKTQEWSGIDYTYVDNSYGGNYTVTDAEPSYNLDLSYLYSGKMPYAVTSGAEADDSNLVNVNRPLLIRANTYKEVTVDLYQYAFMRNLNGSEDENIETPRNKVSLSTAIVIPEILGGDNITHYDVNHKERASVDGTKGVFEYGTSIKLEYNAMYPGKEVYSKDSQKKIRYRFLGWFITYKDVDYYLDNSEIDASHSSTFDVQLTRMNTIDDDDNDMEFIFRAYYVAQYKQIIYSYNISGGEGPEYSRVYNFDFARSAPEIVLTAETTQKIPFSKLNKRSGADVINYGAPISVNEYAKYYRVNTVNSAGSQQVSVDASADKFTSTSKSFAYYIDAGLGYTLEVLTEKAEIDLNKVKNGNALGFCTDTDTLYNVRLNGEAIFDYTSYYNSGKATYYDEATGKGVDASTLTKKATADIGMLTAKANPSGEELSQRKQLFNSAQANQLDIAYVSTATLTFYNITFGGGITVPQKLANDLTGGAYDALTVWDNDDTYGDWIWSNGECKNQGENGEVVIRITLINSSNVGYRGTFGFAYQGMKNGLGVMDRRVLENSTASGGLFSPEKDNDNRFSRWEEINFGEESGGRWVKTYAFYKTANVSGKTTYPTIGKNKSYKKYETENCGDAVTGYNIIDLTTLRNIDFFWKNNGYSCAGVTEPENFTVEKAFDESSGLYQSAKFVVLNNLKLVNCLSGPQIDPTNNAVTWDPLCSTENDAAAQNKGFDGIFTSKGSAVTISGISITSSNANTSVIKYYGLFAKVIGGTISNFQVDNVFMKGLKNYEAVAAIAGYAENATISDITFSKFSDYAIAGGDVQYRNYFNIDGADVTGTRVYIVCQDIKNVGMLVGKAVNSNIERITFNVSDGSSNQIAQIEGGGTVGSLAGVISGGTVKNINVYGNSRGHIYVNVKNSAITVGAIFGQITGGAVAENIKVDKTYMIIGNNSGGVTNVGGIIGVMGGDSIEDKKTVVKGVSFNFPENNNYDINLSANRRSVVSKGVYLFATKLSTSDSTITGDNQYGRTGLIVGYIQGGTLSNKDYSYNIKTVVKANAGTMGGLVGLNAGTVDNIQTGSDFKLLAWLPYDSDITTNSFNVGGHVGFNLGSGIVNECSVVGSSSTTSAAYTDWGIGHVYAFVWTSGSNVSVYKNILSGSGNRPGSALPYTYNFNLTLGGIVGFNMGTIINSRVIRSRISTYINSNACNVGTRTSASIVSGRYVWGVESGLIAGYFAPESPNFTNGRVDNDGFYDFSHSVEDIYGYYGDNIETFRSQIFDYGKSVNMLSPRIQSCFTSNSSIVIAGRAYMDNYTISDFGEDSGPSAVTMAGIAGGSGVNAMYSYSINSCKSINNKYIYEICSGGSTSGGEGNKDPGVGFYRWKNKKSAILKKYRYFSVPNRTNYLTILTIANAVAGLDLNTNANSGAFIYKGTTMQSVTAQNRVEKSELISGTADKWYKNDGYPSGWVERYISYQDFNDTSHVSIYGEEMKDTLCVGGTAAKGQHRVLDVENNVVDYSFILGRLMKTDPSTGALLGMGTMYCDDDSLPAASRKYTGMEIVRIGSYTVTRNGEKVDPSELSYNALTDESQGYVVTKKDELQSGLVSDNGKISFMLPDGSIWMYANYLGVKVNGSGLPDTLRGKYIDNFVVKES